MPGVEVTIGRYCGTAVGQGGFATVYRVRQADGHWRALKWADPAADPATGASLFHEFTVQSQLIHPQVARAYEFGRHEKRPYIVLDWVEGQPLFGQGAPAANDEFAQLLRSLARVLFFVHQRGWVHGDLKPDNLLWRVTGRPVGDAAKREICLLDFGLARPIGDADRPRGAGTVGYCAPEFLTNQPADGRADWYAAGIILYEWIFGVRPYAAGEPALEIAGHLEGAPDFDRPRLRQAPPWADDVIARLLAKSADERAADEHSLLTWLAGFDAALDPTGIVAEQLIWQLRSERWRMRENDHQLLAALREDLDLTGGANWSVWSHGLPSEAWLHQAAAVIADAGHEVRLDRRAGERLELHDCPRDGAPSRVVLRLATSLHGLPESERNPSGRQIALCPYDRSEVHAFLSGTVGDPDVAEVWTDVVHSATAGLPEAVGELLEQMILSGALTVDADGWALDESAVWRWSTENLTRHIARVVGDLGDSERTFCEWLALGEGLGSSGILRRLWRSLDGDPDRVLQGLIARGIVVGRRAGDSASIDLTLRFNGHDALLRSGIPESERSMRSLQLARAVESAAPMPEGDRQIILAHSYARAGVGEKAAVYALATASTAIAAEDRERAMRYIVFARECAATIADPALRSHWTGHARMTEADLQKSLGQFDAARRIYQELLRQCRASGEQRLMAETLHDLGDLYWKTRRYLKGIRVESRAKRIWENLGDRAELSRSLNSLGHLCRIAGDLAGARMHFSEALGIQQELGLDRMAAINLNNLGIISYLEYQFENAESCYRQALEIHRKLANVVEVARGFNNLATISFVQGRLDESMDGFARAAQLASEAGALSDELYFRRNLVEVALEQGDLRKAAAIGQHVYQHAREVGDASSASEVCALLADIYQHAGDFRLSDRLQRETELYLMTIQNEELQVYLRLQRAHRAWMLQRDDEATLVLDSLLSTEGATANRYQYLDALTQRARLAVRDRDSDALARIWQEGERMAGAIRAPHKAAQLAAACLTDMDDSPLNSRLAMRVEEFLAASSRWNWAPAFLVWKARAALRARRLDDAFELANNFVEQVRQDGHWDSLWRGLVLKAAVCHALADYEPAWSALEEAERTLRMVASTIEDEGDRRRYGDCADARALTAIKNRIAELVG
ncbi:MAG TPA: tetratricopeptide repeat protein [bacterium]|nr:tetratricopeptide repeat protein [bacterium]